MLRGSDFVGTLPVRFGLRWWVCVGSALRRRRRRRRFLHICRKMGYLWEWVGNSSSPLTCTDSVQEARLKMSNVKNSEVVSNLDVINPVLVSTGRDLIGKGTEAEAKWFWKSVQLLEDNLISVRGVQMSMEEVLSNFAEDVKFPSLTSTMVQYFKQSAVLMRLSGWEGSPAEAIRTIQNGKRSSKYETSKDFDKDLAVAKSAKSIKEKANQPKRASKVAPKVEGATVTTLEGAKVQTFSEAVVEFKKVAMSRTSHFITPEALADARFIMALLNKQIKAQESKDAQAVEAVA